MKGFMYAIFALQVFLFDPVICMGHNLSMAVGSDVSIDTVRCSRALGLKDEFEKFIQQRQQLIDTPTEDNLVEVMATYDDLARHVAKRSRIKPLHEASMNDDIKTINKLVEDEGVSVNTRGLNGGDTPLFTAAPNALDRLLELGADPNASNIFGDTPLHYFATYENPQHHIDVLISQGADIEAKNLLGHTPIYAAIQHGNIDAFHALRSHGASLRVETIFAPNALFTNYIYSPIELQQIDYMDFDENFNADEGQRVRRTTMAKLVLDADPSLLQAVDFVYKANVLHWASSFGDIDAMDFYLKKGLSPTQVNGNGENPLHVAARSDQVEAFQMLAFIYPRLMEAVDKDGHTPMDSARHHNAEKVLEFLKGYHFQ